MDFHPDLTDRAAIRPLIEADPGVQARARLVGETLDAWWAIHSPRICELPARSNLNAVRGEILASFVSALEPLAVLDHFRLAGVVAAWWTASLPDFKTLLEHGFSGVIDGWIDAIADALRGRRWTPEMFAKTESLQDSPEAYLKKVGASSRARSAAFEVALRSGRPMQAGDRVTYYIAGTKKSAPAWQSAKAADELDPSTPDENVACYIDKLDDLAAKFDAFVPPGAGGDRLL